MHTVLWGLDALARKIRKCPRRPLVWKYGNQWWVQMPGKWHSVGHVMAMETWRGAFDVALLWVYAEYEQGDGSIIWRTLAKHRQMP